MVNVTEKYYDKAQALIEKITKELNTLYRRDDNQAARRRLRVVSKQFEKLMHEYRKDSLKV